MFSEPLLLKCKSVIFDSVSHRVSLRPATRSIIERVAASHPRLTVSQPLHSASHRVYMTYMSQLS